jgi:prepilin-type N-terminal cleavage/methylation domain-containing protein
MNNRNKKGFTLIELLVVIAIIGLLATLSVISLNNARQKSRDTRRVSDIKQMQTALELYYNDIQLYPLTADVVTTIASSSVTYMGSVPVSPSIVNGTTTYTYTSAAGTTYTLQYYLEGVVGAISAGLHTATNSSIY